MREGDGAQQPPRQLCSNLQPRGGQRRVVSAFPKTVQEPGWFTPCHEASSHRAVTSPCSPKPAVPAGCAGPTGSDAWLPLPTHTGAGQHLEGQNQTRIYSPSLAPGCQPGRTQSKTSDTIDFATPVLHTYLYSHHSVPLTPHLLGISRKTKSR